MIIDIGGGITDVGIISLGGMVMSKNIRIAGDRFNQDIVSYIRNEQDADSEKSAKEVKIQ